MKVVELYGRVRYAVQIEGLSFALYKKEGPQGPQLPWLSEPAGRAKIQGAGADHPRIGSSQPFSIKRESPPVGPGGGGLDHHRGRSKDHVRRYERRADYLLSKYAADERG